MSTLTINTYLVDDNRDYVLHDLVDATSRIILSTQSLEVDFSLARLGQAAKTRPVLAFDVKKDASDNWYLITNKQTLVGRFPEQSYALGALFGCFMYHSGNPDAFAFWIEDCLSKGGSSIDDSSTVTPIIDFDVDIIPDPAILLSQAEASVTNNSTGVPNGVNFTYEWYRQSAVATGITLTGGS